jgi:hypothetical protein
VRGQTSRSLPERGPELGDAYVAETSGSAGTAGGNMLVRMKPQRWLSVDYRKQYGG